MYHPLDLLAEACGQKPDQLLYLFCMLQGFAACLVLGQIDNIMLRKLWSTTSGLAIGFYFYGINYILNIGYVLVNYLIMACCERQLASTLMTFWTGLMLLFVTFSHLWLSENSQELEIDIIFLMNSCKFHMMAVNYSNAEKLEDPEKSKEMTTRERYYAEPLRKRAGLMDFVHFYFFCGASWTGMCHEYRDFDDFINKKDDYANIPKDKLFMQFFIRFIHWVGCLITMIILLSTVNYEYLLTDEWANSPFWFRLVYLIGTSFLKVYTYFVGFVAMECFFIACGQGYKPEKKLADGTI